MVSVSEKRWTADDIPDQTGRTVIVTGANSGLGLAAATALAEHGATVILAVRDEAKGRGAVDRIRGRQPDADVSVRRLDLADLDSVRGFARSLHADEVGLDALINNAGVMMPPRSLSTQGNETQFAANHLGHFALTGLLLDLFRDPDGDSRVVTVSSTLHKRGRIHFDDLTGEHSYSPIDFYAQSKFANVLFGLELDRRLRAAGSPIRSVLAHPGYSATNLQTAGPTGLMKLMGRIGNVVLAQSAEMGALPELYGATSPDAQGGQFFGPDGRGESKGHPTVVQPIPSATVVETARRLWDVSEELTGVRYDLPAVA